MDGNGCVSVCLSLRCYSSAQALDRGEICLRTSAKLPGRHPPRHCTGRGQVNEGVMFGELRVLLFVCFRSVHGWMGMDV